MVQASKDVIILVADSKGKFTVDGVPRGEIVRVDIADVDLIITTKSGAHYLLPGAAINALGEHPPEIAFSNGVIPSDQLLAEVGAVIDLNVEVPMPSSLKLNGAQEGGEAKDNAHVQKDQQTQPQPQTPQEQQDQQDAKDAQAAQVSTLTVNTEQSVEQLISNIKAIDENIHKSDYDYVPPHQFDPPPAPLASPAGVPPPISLTPLATLFMGNVVGTTSSVIGGVNYIYGGGGADGTDPAAQLGPRDALQYSPATIAGTSGNDVIYADGTLVGNTDPATARTMNAKEFLLNVAGYFTQLNDISISGVPSGVAIVGATNNGGGNWTLPSSYVLQNQAFTIVYDMDAWRTSGSNTFDLSLTISGASTRHVAFTTTQNFRFEFVDVTNSTQVTDPTLVYDFHGQSREIYVLPTQSNASIINSGDGNDMIYGDRNVDTVTAGNGNDTIYTYEGDDVVVTGNGNSSIDLGTGNNSLTAGSGNNIVVAADGANFITVGNGTNSITLGNGNNIVASGSGADTITAGNGNNTIHDTGGVSTITTGSGNDAITLANGGGNINVGAGNNTIALTTTNGSTDTYILTTSGTGTNTITGGDDLYDISMGAGTNSVTIGNGTDAYNTQITTGAGTNSVTTGNGQHTINLGAGASIVTTGSGNDALTVAGGGGTENLGAGNNTITINSAAGSTNLYTLTTSGTGTNAITAGDDLYVVNVGAGTNTIALGNGTDAFNSQITAGAGTNSVTTGNGRHTISLGSGASTITTGSGNDAVTVINGGGTINLGGGTNAITVNSTAGSTDTYNLTTTGVGTTIVGGDDLYVVSVGTGSNSITLGNGTDGFNTQITAGAGTNSVTTGNGQHTINLGAGLATVVTGLGADSLTVAGGGGTVDLGAGNNTIVINSLTNATDTYTLRTSGTGTTGITGGDDNYLITLGNTGADTVVLGNGSSTVTTSSGADHITVGNGAMSISAGDGDNVIVTGTGAVNITTGSGNDTITTSGGGGTISAGDGNNNITVTTGNYTITTGIGNDTISAGGGNNSINAGDGTNSITVTNGNNTIIGGAGNDTIIAGNGNNTFRLGLGTNSVTAGTGSNTIDFTDLGVTVTANLAIGYATGVGFYDYLTGISNVTGNNFGDRITGTTGNNIIIGGSGNDTISGNGGNDTIYGNDGNDVIRGGSGNDTLYGGNGNNTIYTGSGGVDLLYGGSGNNTFVSQHAGVVYNGTWNGSTNANLVAGQANAIDYTADTVDMSVDLSTGQGTGGFADGDKYAFTSTAGYNSINKIFGPSNVTVHLTGSNSDDYFVAGSSANTAFVGGAGNNTLVGGSEVNYYVMSAANGVSGNDTIIASANGYDQLNYGGGVGLVINLDSVSHTFNKSIFGAYTGSVTDAAYSGTNKGLSSADTTSSQSNGDYYTPISGTTDTGIDLITGSNGGDIVYVGSRGLTYYEGIGTNFFFGGGGNDNFNASGAAVSDHVDGGGGTSNYFSYGGGNNETVNLSGAGDANGNGIADYIDAGISSLTDVIGANTGFARFGNSTIDYLDNIQNVIGGSGNDYIVGDNNANIVDPGSGSNTIITLGGNDTIYAYNGADTIDGGAGIDTVIFQSSLTTNAQVFLADANFLGSGSDKATAWGASFSGYQARTGSIGSYVYSSITNVENIVGTDYNDILYGDANANVITGNNGDDIIAGNGGADTLSGNNGNDTFYIKATDLAAVTLIDGGSGTDTLRVTGLSSITAGSWASADAKYNSIEVVDARNSTNGEAFSLNSNDIVAMADNGTASSVKLYIDSGDTFTASFGGTTATHTNSSTVGVETTYTYLDASNATVATLVVHLGA